jgi:hypothetical protein
VSVEAVEDAHSRHGDVVLEERYRLGDSQHARIGKKPEEGKEKGLHVDRLRLYPLGGLFEIDALCGRAYAPHDRAGQPSKRTWAGQHSKRVDVVQGRHVRKQEDEAEEEQDQAQLLVVRQAQAQDCLLH